MHRSIRASIRTCQVTIDTKRKLEMLPTLWIMLQADNGVPGVFEWGLRNLPYDDQPVCLRMVIT